MSFDENILSGLRDYSKQPPKDFFEAIRKKAGEGVPVGMSLNQALSTEYVFKKLSDYQVAPPAQLYQNILTEIKVQAAKPAKVVNLFTFKRALAVAASLLLIAGIWWLAGDKNQVQNAEPVAVTNTPTQPLNTLEQPTIPAPVGEAITNNGGNHHKNSFASLQKSKKGTRFSQPALDTFGIMIDGASFVVKDNDLFATFTSFDYNNLPAFLTAEEAKSKKIRIDYSTAINLSENMVAMMQRMYKTKANGKPTRKAIRMKKKMDKWKEADKVYFDKFVEKNPIDPIDLGEFLF